MISSVIRRLLAIGLVILGYLRLEQYKEEDVKQALKKGHKLVSYVET